MKFLTVFVALLSVALANQGSWSLNQLSEAIQNPSTDPAVLPYLEQALNEMMDALFAGEPMGTVTVTIPALDLSSWSLTQLSDAILNPNTDPALLPYLEDALNQMMVALVSGQPVGPATATTVIPSMQISLWTLSELSDAIQSPATNPALVPHLEHALNEMMDALYAGQHMETIIVVAPVGLLLPAENPIAPLPVDVSPIVVAPIESPIVPTPVEIPVAPSSPLVQIIVNVNKGASSIAPAPVMTPEPAIVPEPVIVVEQPEIVPEPVIIVDGPSVIPEQVIVVESPSMVPEPIVIGTPVLPNPVDLLHPVGVVNPIGAGAAIVGPIV